MKLIRLSVVYIYIFICCLLLIINGCSKSSGSNPEKKEETDTTGKNSGPYKLNVIYFLPKGQDSLPEYEKRMSDMLFFFQDFYGKEMKRNGFGEKTFSLQTNSGGKRVTLTVINGALPASGYPYKDGSGPMMAEINAYFRQHPEHKKSEHYLVITPVPDIDHADVPYYGIGNWAFILDYSKLDIKKYGLQGAWLSGNAHELGHGLGLPHDKCRKSEAATLGNSLMSASDFTTGAMLTKAACAILNNCQLFNSTAVNDYQQYKTAYAKNLNVSYESGDIVVAGRFYADKPVNGINFYQDPDAHPDAYDAPSWSVAPLNGDSFYVRMPVNDLWELEGGYTLRLDALGSNGSRMSITTYNYSFINQQPVLDPAIGSKTEIPKTGWAVTDVDSEEPGFPAVNVLDGDPSTYWHTQYTNGEPNHPHQLTIDMLQTHILHGLTFRDRAGVWPGIKEMTVFTKQENGQWKEAGVFTLRKADLPQFIVFSQVQQARYFRIITTNSYDNGLSCALAEVGAY